VLPYQVSVSPTFYKQLLRVQIPKAQKDSLVTSVILHLWDLGAQKLHENMFVKSTQELGSGIEAQ